MYMALWPGNFAISALIQTHASEVQLADYVDIDDGIVFTGSYAIMRSPATPSVWWVGVQ